MTRRYGYFTKVLLFIRLLIGRELDYLQKSYTMQLYGRRLLLLTNNIVRRLPCLWTTTVLRHVLIVALGVHVRNDRPYTHATLHRFNMCEKY